jgi:anaerobic selenocysteine-containing dehydrogenase
MSKISRRDFLKIGAISIATLAAEYKFMALVGAERPVGGGKSVSRTTGVPRHPVPSTCLLCPAHCGIIGFLEDNILVKIEGNPRDPNSRGRLCARGQAGIQQVYNPDRLLFPMMRKGPRGSGEWQRISWDEAYNQIAARLREVRQSGRPEEFVFAAGIQGLSGIGRRFMRAFGTPNVVEEAALYRANKEVAQELTWGARKDVNDVAHTRYMLNFGANPYEAHALYLGFVQRIIEGRMRGAKLVTFDPRLSNTAGKSDEWFPLRPGTDGIVALAMANVIMQLNLHDEDFLDTWTNYPAQELAAHLRKYTPGMAEEISGVPADDIRRIAIEFASNKPATTISAGGATMHRNGVQNERAIALLNIITGNIDVKGGYCLPRTHQLGEPEPQPEALTHQSELLHPADFPLALYGVVQGVMSAIKEGRQRVQVFMSYGYNPAYSAPQSHLSAEVLADESLIPYYVAVDSYMSESAALADIVLPAATYLESWGIESVPSYEMVPFVTLRQPVVAPQGQSLPFDEICIELAQRIGDGMEKYLAFGTVEDYIKAAIAPLEGLVRAGGLDYLKEYGVWFDPTVEPEYRMYEKGGFNTPSGKIEVYSPRLAEKGFSPLPTYEPIPDHGKMGDDELFLITFQWNVHTYGITANSMWLSEIVHDSPLWINKETAKAKGIKKGDLVEVRSSVGSVKAKAFPVQGIHPRVVAIGGSCGHWGYGRVAQAQRFDSNDPNTRLIWWDRSGNGANPSLIIPVAADPIGGGQSWDDTIVTIVKA